MPLIWLPEIPSTHNLLKSLLAGGAADYIDAQAAEKLLQPLTMTAARCQTAGRGQRGNSWESEDFKNLTFSLPFYPESVPPAAQFSISEAVALAVVSLLKEYGITSKIKWPNDIYVDDKKICGILIDHSLLGMAIQHTVISAGLNVNQTDFLSDAPNPVSMKNLSGKDYDLDEIACRLLNYINEYLSKTDTPESRLGLHEVYMSNLYRNDGNFHPYRDLIANERIMARITDISPLGILTLTLPDSSTRSYAFKQLSFLT